ncbi:MAG: glycoside hydrolase family 95 protein [Bacteroidota bacterium]|nr:glycoside hydrolase family 95 protein [Bacteroidota bacterium]
MKRFFLIWLFILYATFSHAQHRKSNDYEMCWWYDKPATKYWEGLPIATGRFAAMIGGKTGEEDIVFNDETLWSGGPYDPNNLNGPQILAKVRKLILERNYVEANEEAMQLNSMPTNVQHYQPMGTLNISFNDDQRNAVANYKRKLSMDSATVTITYKQNGVNFKREIFASYPDQVIVIHITADRPGSINLRTGLSSLQPSAQTKVINGDLVMNGTNTGLAGDGYTATPVPAALKWSARLRSLVDGGTVTYGKAEGRTGDMIKIDKANTVTLLLAGATSWKSWNDVSADEKARCDKYIAQAATYNYNELKQRHLSDYMPLFAGCKLDLGGGAAGMFNTSGRMKKIEAGEADPLYIAQYFQYGRYLMLAGAREGTLAFNNHNMWLNNMEGRWQGRWTMNINLEECYWPVESTNLAPLNQSLLLFTEQLAQAGRRTAAELYNCRGWVAHHGTDVWFNTAPTDRNREATLWPMGGAWLMQQLYDHFQYDPDKKYLERIYPLLVGASEFFLDYLITDPATGYLVTCPSTSPENNFLTDDGKIGAVTMGSTMDNELLRNLFGHTMAAAKILGKDHDLCGELDSVYKRLQPLKIGKFGQLQEWMEDVKENDTGHRHISHLFASYPDDAITLRKTPELAKAVKVVLRRRGDINRGWSGAWKINQHARLEEPEAAYKILIPMLTDVSIHPRAEDSRITPSFEGNQGIQGITAGIAEMLMQSHSGEISLLPALPAEWQKGSITGLRGRGGYTVDIQWNKQQLRHATLISRITQTCRLRTKRAVKIVSGGKNIPARQVEKNVYVFKVIAGKKYKII